MTLKTFSRYLAAGVAFGAMLGAAQAADNRGVVQGIVNNAAGQPVAGAMVKLINADRHLTFMVISQGQGRFEANDLPPGQYVVQGIGGGFESNKSAPVNIEGGKNAKIDLTLANKQGAVLPPSWPQRIPEEQIKRIPIAIRAKYFQKNGQPGYFEISKDIRNRVDYQKHDLLSLAPVRKDFGLIVCKNVLLHLKEAERVEVIRMFHDALESRGFFVTEQTQKLPSQVSELWHQVVSNAQVFMKR